MSHARVEMIVVGFPGGRLTGRIVPALQDLMDRQLIRVIDLRLVEKDADGKVTSTSLSSVGNELREAFEPIRAEITGTIDDDDVADLGASLTPGDAAAVMLFEHLWALPFTDAVRESGGELRYSMEVPADVVEAMLDEP
jgi:uncharacterized membrane protein